MRRKYTDIPFKAEYNDEDGLLIRVTLDAPVIMVTDDKLRVTIKDGKVMKIRFGKVIKEEG